MKFQNNGIIILILKINMDIPLLYYKLKVLRYQILNGNMINLLGANINIKIILVKLGFIIIRYKISYNKIMLKFQKNGNIHH